MLHAFGVDAAKVKSGDRTPVVWNSATAVNGHMLVVGMSGAGKTHQLRNLVKSLQETTEPGQQLRIHVFDVHGDIDIPGCSTVQFSEQTEYGLNPLVVNPDPHYGGTRKRIQSVIATINKTSRQLGGKQEAVLRNLLTDLYESMGFRANDPTTWGVDTSAAPEMEVDESGRLYLDVPITEKDEAKSVGARWDGVRRCWWVMADSYTGPITKWLPKVAGRRNPTMLDALRYSKHVLKAAFLGSNEDAVNALESVNRMTRAYHSKVVAALKRGDKLADDEKLKGDLEKSKEKALASFQRYVESIETGRELDDVLKYDSVDVLKSVVDRLENLSAIGIFKNHLPPFDTTCPVWRYHIQALAADEQKLFVLFRLQELFVNAVQLGETKYIRDVIVLDEASKYCDDDEQNIVNIIAKEGRKFGLAEICLSQAPTHFADDFISSVGTKVILGIDEMFWDSSVRKLRVDIEGLKFIKPRERILVQIKQSGEARNDWRWVYLNKNEQPARRMAS